MTTDTKSENSGDEQRPTPAARNRGGSGGKDTRKAVTYRNRQGVEVTVGVESASSVDEVVESGTWDVPQKERDDIEDKPIIVFEAIKMEGQYGSYAVVLASTLESLDSDDPEQFSVAFNNVPYNKIRRVMGFDEDGNKLEDPRFPVTGKLVKRKGAKNTYWDFVDSDWLPERK